MYQFRPISVWPGKPTSNPKRSPFGAAWSTTIKDLERELAHLGAKNVVLQAYVGETNIRRDGMLYADARPSRPGVILAFDSKHGPLAYPCDTYATWQENVRAIVLALGALRAVERYGVTRRAEQYKGWQALAAPTAGPMELDEARRVIRDVIGQGLFDALSIDEAIREALKRSHPDTGGDAETFKRVMKAKAAIEGDRR